MGRPIRGADIKDVVWVRPDGNEMTDKDWNSSWIRCIGMLLAGEVPNEITENGEPLIYDTLLIILNSHWDKLSFLLPATSTNAKWEVIIDSSTQDITAGNRIVDAGEPIEIPGRSTTLLRQSRT